jgi:hypothetical protein
VEAVIAAGSRSEDLAEVFAEVEVAAEVELVNVNPWERRFVVSIARKPTLDLEAAWPQLREW